MTERILFVGDIHLGRTPRRLAEAGLDADRLGPAEALQRVVRAADEHQVQAVVLAGDVVDQDKDRFEAFAHLKNNVHALLQAGVRVLGVAGNHDHFALPRLANRLPDFHLLGAGGRWECVHLNGVDLIGWSFPSRHHRGNPLHSDGLQEALAMRRSDCRALGVIHADLDKSASSYAPVMRADLEAVQLDGWLLGHIHQPGLCGEGRPLGYLGSLVGLDRSEHGPRGPWLVAPEPSGVSVRQIPVGPVHWLNLEVDVSDVLEDADVDDVLHSRVEAALVDASDGRPWFDDGDFAAVGASVTFVGRTKARRAVDHFIRERQPDELVFPVGGVPHAVVHVSNRTRPALDLEALASQRTPLGRLAGLLRSVEAGEALPPVIRETLHGFTDAAWAVEAERHPRPDDRTVLRAAALRLLDQLMEQDAVVEVS